MPVIWTPTRGEHVKIVRGPASGRTGTIQKRDGGTVGPSYQVLVDRDERIWALYEDIEPQDAYTDWGGWCRGFGEA